MKKKLAFLICALMIASIPAIVTANENEEFLKQREKWNQQYQQKIQSGEVKLLESAPKQVEFYTDTESMTPALQRLYTNLGTCEKDTVKSTFGNKFVMGTKNGICLYREELTNQSAFCQMPMSAAKNLSEELLQTINSEDSQAAKEIKDKYCRIINK